MDTVERLASHSPDSLVGSIAQFVVAIDHVAIAVENLNDAIDWYVGKLGFTLIERRRTVGEYTAMISAVLCAGSAIVVLVQGLSADSQVSRFIEKFGPGVQHVAFQIEDMQATLEAYQRNGGQIDTPMLQDEGIRQVFLRRNAASGVRVELIERRGGNFSDASVERLFRAFEARELY